MTDTKALQMRIKESGLKQSFIAKTIGLSPFGFAQKRNNINEFKPSEIKMLCDLLKINTHEEMLSIFFADKVD